MTVQQNEGAKADATALTRDLVAAASPNPPGDERAVAAVLADYLADIPGVEVRTFAARPERPNLVFGAGEGARTLTLAAHLDTHPVVGRWRFDPLGEIAGNRLYGRGTTDNKGAVAAMAAAFRETVRRGVPDGLQLVFVANADEELGGAEGVSFLCRQPDLNFGAVVVAEPSGIFASWEALYIAARGTSRFSLSTGGVRTHSSLMGQADVESALENLHGAVDHLRARLPVMSQRHVLFGSSARLTVVRLEGGEGYGVVPWTAHADVELRVMPGATQDSIERSITKVAGEMPVRLDFAEGSLRWMGPSELPDDHPLTQATASAWEKVFGKAPVLACFPGGTDARLFADAGWAALAGVGPGALVRAHQPDEYVTFDEIETAVDLYVEIIAQAAADRSDAWS